MAAPSAVGSRLAPSSRGRALETAQGVVQQLIRVATELFQSLGLPEGASQESVGRMLQEYADFLWSLDQKADGLQLFYVPLDSIHHLDHSGLALGPWCQGLVGRLRSANQDARERVAPLDGLCNQLSQAGWGASEPSAASSSTQRRSGARPDAGKRSCLHSEEPAKPRTLSPPPQRLSRLPTKRLKAKMLAARGEAAVQASASVREQPRMEEPAVRIPLTRARHRRGEAALSPTSASKDAALDAPRKRLRILNA
mmetsp:Transcript_29052/g.67580  ORF Transcript_29052/g.67580 Transcript_29052/m.67580 type:complete len:254 (+) Transcript_29052:28-789(+)